MDLAKSVTRAAAEDWHEATWQMADDTYQTGAAAEPRIIAFDYGCKHNILRCLTEAGCAVEVVPATTSAADVLARQPDGLFLSDDPGDPAATASYASQTIREIAETGLPVFGICIGHQLIAEAFGASTTKWDAVTAAPITRSRI